jgi:hypothetical protein
LDSSAQPLMLGKVIVDGFGLINVNFHPCPYQILTSMGGLKKTWRLTKQECHNPTLRECEDETRTLETGTWESSGTTEISEFDYRGQNTSHWGVLYIIEKLSKCRCRKWARMGHLDIYNTSYGKKKGRESNWQFDSQPLKIENRHDPGACRWSATHCWKALEESYKFNLDLIPIGGLSKKL